MGLGSQNGFDVRLHLKHASLSFALIFVVEQ